MRQCSRLLFALAVSLGLHGYLAACQSPHSILRVEEDWELVLREPDSWLDSPQMSTWMSPADHLESIYFAADWNHAQRPDFSAGGFQTKAFQGEALVQESLSETGDNLTASGEVVHWTQAMFLDEGALTFMLLHGQGSSWGSFGGPSTAVSIANSPFLNLNGYSPLRSAEWSGVGFGANRVQSFKLLRVRFFLDSGEIVQTELNIEVAQQQEG